MTRANRSGSRSSARALFTQLARCESRRTKKRALLCTSVDVLAGQAGKRAVNSAQPMRECVGQNAGKKKGVRAQQMAAQLLLSCPLRTSLCCCCNMIFVVVISRYALLARTRVFRTSHRRELGIRVQEYHLVRQLNSLVYAYCHSVHTPTAAPCADGQGSLTKPYGLFFRVLSKSAGDAKPSVLTSRQEHPKESKAHCARCHSSGEKTHRQVSTRWSVWEHS